MKITNFSQQNTEFAKFLVFKFAVIFPILAVILICGAVFAQAAAFTVNNTGDAGDSSIGNGICATSGGVCTLRAAIEEANFSAGIDDINFNITGAGIKTIAPASIFPFITAPVRINGASQPGADCTAVGGLLIEINGASAGASIGQGGLEFKSGASGSIVRGLVINGFGGYGLYLDGTGSSFIQCNYIGTTAAGTAALGNNNSGIRIASGNNNTVGGTNAGDRNVISGNRSDGIRLAGNNTIIQGNYVGINADGTAALSNSSVGVNIESSLNVTVGGTSAAARNVISGNNVGVFILSNSSGIIVRGNYIGTNAAGTGPVGNSAGVYFNAGANNNIVGGTGAGEANIIAFNARNGITVDTFNSPINNSFRGNSIFSNSGLGIDLGGFNGTITPNDAGDPDSGSNNLQNFPIISMTAPGMLTASIDSFTANSAYPITIDFYANAVCDASGNGEGEVFLGSVTAAAPGSYTFNYATDAGKPIIAATATDANGNTSEFSPCATQATAAAVSISGRVTNSFGRGLGQAFVTITRSNGAVTTALTNPFGYYHFNEIPAGATYIFNVRHKRYQFTPQAFNILEETGNLNFVAK